jgi:hypothetical protein
MSTLRLKSALNDLTAHGYGQADSIAPTAEKAQQLPQ